MIWAVKPKAQIFEGLGWYFGFHGPLGLESGGTIKERGKNVVRPVNKPLTIFHAAQSLVVQRLACLETSDPATTG